MAGVKVVLLLGVFFIAGCVSPGDEASPAAATIGEGQLLDDALNATALVEVGPMPWLEDERERLLYEGTTVAEQCASYAQGDLGCMDDAGFELAKGTVIPWGTRALRIEADATQALKAGGYLACLYNRGRSWPAADAEPTSSPVHIFRFEMLPSEWDSTDTSSAYFCFWPRGPGHNLLDGAIRARVVAERDLKWTPAVPTPVPLVDLNATWTFGPADLTSDAPDVRFAPIPEDVATLTVSYSWTVRTCASDHDCAPNPGLIRGDSFIPGNLVERTDRHLITSYNVGDALPPDDRDADASEAYIDPFVYRCWYAVPAAPCLASFFATGTTLDVRVLVQAWPSGVDETLIRDRLGVDAPQ